MKRGAQFVFSAILLVLLFSLGACGRGVNQDNGDEQGNGAENGSGGGVHLHADAGVLTVSSPMGISARMFEVAEAFSRSLLAEQGIELFVDVQTYLPDERNGHFEQMLSKFAAGVGPDLFVADSFHLFHFIEHGFLADIYTLMDDMNRSRDVFFTNALESFEIDGRLYMLPMQFGFDFIGINANVPPAFITRFSEFDTVSSSDIMAIYMDLIYEYPEWGEFALIHGFQAQLALTPEINHMVDFANRSADFANAGMVDFMYRLRSAFAGNMRFNTPFVGNLTEDSMAMLQERYVFIRPFGIDSATNALFNFQTPFFVHHIPLADESGHLVNRSWGLEIAVNAAAEGSFAWLFIEQLLSWQGAQDLNFWSNANILRQYNREYITRGFEGAHSQFNARPMIDSLSIAANMAADRIERYSLLPITSPVVNFFIPPFEFLEPFSAFIEGDAPAEDVLLQMENTLNAWFAEERVIEPFAEAEPADLPDLPMLTLNVRANDRHTGVFQQAAEAMNESWRAQNRPYFFNLVIDDYSWIDWEGAEARRERLHVEFMAGQGPDIFYMPPFSALEFFNIRNYAGAGVLADIYALMDACPHTNREDFFTNVLNAFEINGELYVLPLSFAFEHVGINAGLPQSYIDRFSANDTITVAEMMEIFMALMDSHRDDFGHLSPGVSLSLSSVAQLIISNMDGFIDFNNRASNLTDPAFVSFLRDVLRVFDGREWIGSGWTTTAPSNEFFQNRAEEQFFEMGNSGLQATEAFFLRESPHFVNYTPLVDEQGRIVIDAASDNIWGILGITNAGNPTLAWEFIRYLLQAYYQPVGRAGVEPNWGTALGWNSHSIASPIKRSMFESQVRRAFENVLNFETGFMDIGDLDSANRQIDSAINRIAALNEMPMAIRAQAVPTSVWAGPEGTHLNNFVHGAMTPEAFAQQIHNGVSLWLIEQS